MLLRRGNRELDLQLIDYADLARPHEQWRNVYEVTEEFYAPRALKRIGSGGFKLAPTRTLTAPDTQNGLH